MVDAGPNLEVEDSAVDKSGAPVTLRVAALTSGLASPSARFRVRQLREPLLSHGIALQEFAARPRSAPPSEWRRRPLWALGSLVNGLYRASRSYSHDVTLLHRTFISRALTFEPLTMSPRVFDFDDAIWLHNESMARRAIELSDAVICGNAYLADWARQFSANVAIVPTGIDTERYTPVGRPSGDHLVLGWIGTSSNLPQLEKLEPALNAAMQEFPNTRLRVVCDRAPKFGGLVLAKTEFAHWEEAREIAEIQGFDIGLMPVADSEWGRGKCAFKMIQYMSCGVPVVTSPVGMNGAILDEFRVGLAPANQQEWAEAICALLAAPEERRSFGAVGRATAVEVFDSRITAGQVAQVISAVYENSRSRPGKAPRA